MNTKLPVVAIIGRVNVGKSTLLNRISERQKAIVSPLPGTTRDLIEAQITWNAKSFHFIDSGGIEQNKDDEITQNVQKQTESIMRKADVILFVVDGNIGVVPEDKTIAKKLKKLKNKVILGVNKMDNPRRRTNVTGDIWKLNFENTVLFSALNGTGTGDLLDVIVSLLPKKNPQKEIEKSPKIVIIGKPNVGKSTLLNSLAGETKSIVSNIPHTTRDSQDLDVTWNKKNFTFIDTAGLRKKSRIGVARNEKDKSLRKYLSLIEKQSTQISLVHIKKSDVVLLMLDGSAEITVQDMKLAELLKDQKKPTVILVNKWDLIPDKNAGLMKKKEKEVKSYFPHLRYAPVLFISGLEKQHIYKIFGTITELLEKNNLQIDQQLLSDFLHRFIQKNPAIRAKKRGDIMQQKRPLVLKSLTQISTQPLIFILKSPHPKDVPKGWLELMKKRFSEHFQLTGCIIEIITKKH